ncbi:hypothetical protein niasHT_038382 [Heterodera trifolii]|uniref:Uncharacterized protein n=1 Tax=Heterodera trifolii TaxID=157864 RepID=A0ABD2IV61_9BILA
MELLLFRHDEFEKLYGCDGFNADKIPLEQRTNIVNGCILITVFFIFELAMSMNALETGILGIIGAVYCDYPLLIYTTGSLGLSVWFVKTSAEMFLAINRCMELLRPELAHAIFSGKKLRCLFALPICYGFAIAMFTESPLFSAVYFSWFFNPYFGYTDDFGKTYHNMMHTRGCPPLVYLLLNKRIRNDCANFCRAIFRFLRNANNSVSNGPTAMAWMTPNYAGNNANNRNNNHMPPQQQ